MDMASETVKSKLLTNALGDEGFKKFYEGGRLRRALARALMAIRKSAGLTQSDLGKELGLPQSSIARLEGDTSGVLRALERLGNVSKACNTSALLFFVDNETGQVKSALSIVDDEKAENLARKIEGLNLNDLPEATVYADAFQTLDRAINAAKIVRSFESKSDAWQALSDLRAVSKP
jgi:transcriptional regulator with XRE-family HTH domain